MPVRTFPAQGQERVRELVPETEPVQWWELVRLVPAQAHASLWPLCLPRFRCSHAWWSTTRFPDPALSA